MSWRPRTTWWTSARGAGTHGGEVVFEGTYAGLQRSGTLTGQFLKQQLPIKDEVRAADGQDDDQECDGLTT